MEMRSRVDRQEREGVCSARESMSASSALTNAFFENLVNLDDQVARTMLT